MRVRGVKAFLLRRAGASEIPTRLGPCEVCGGSGEVRYMVAAKLPRYMYLCREHYMRIRDRLERKLKEMLRRGIS